MQVWIRADGNEAIASGHLRRTLSIAQELRLRGADVTFLLADDVSRSFFLEMTDTNRERWVYLSLGIPYGNTEEELPVLQQMVKAGKPDWLLVDSYAAGETYLSGLRECRSCRTAYIDDLALFDPDVDLVINYAPDAAGLRPFYRRRKRRLLGASYAPLRAQFSRLVPQVREEVSAVLISTGGTDPYHMADEIGSRVEKAGLTPRFLAPGHAYVEKVAVHMQSCDLAVSGGGTTLYELCAAGVPTLSWSMADNQAVFAGKMAEAGACSYAGDIRDEAERSRVLCQVDDWICTRADAYAGRAIRERESAQMHALTDGKGASRIAGELLR